MNKVSYMLGYFPKFTQPPSRKSQVLSLWGVSNLWWHACSWGQIWIRPNTKLQTWLKYYMFCDIFVTWLYSSQVWTSWMLGCNVKKLDMFEIQSNFKVAVWQPTLQDEMLVWSKPSARPRLWLPHQDTIILLFPHMGFFLVQHFPSMMCSAW